ncbi:extracellular solute-binding protein [Leifsonia aquatica]|uniref:extracellular solute-binding protein n=1 Tax=Leifsonia aquatica TaxID=144185 RepID=UPI0004682438|nr:extracellular solute-binding protein [Leifsonia aquatica]
MLTTRRLLPTVALVAAGLAALTACSATADATSTGSATPAPSVTIVSGQSAQNGQLLKKTFDGYNSSATAATTVTLQLSADSDIDTAQKALVDIASGHGPDAVRVTSATYRTLVDAGAAQPADTCLATDPALKKSLDPSIMSGLTVKGHVYQIPWYATPNALFYNADLFRAAGLDPDTPPTTLSEFHADARAIAATGAAGGTAYFGNDYNFQSYVASLGGAVYDPASGKLGIDSKAGRAVFDLFASMAKDGSSPVYTNYFQQANEAFAGGKLGMIVTSTSAYPALKASGAMDLRLAPVPAMDGGSSVAALSTNGFVITTKDPNRQKAVCDALLTLLTPETVTATVAATATIPLRTDLADDAKYLRPVYAQNPEWTAIRDQKSVAWQPLPGTANAEYSSAYVDDQLRVLRGDLSPADAAAQLQKTATGLLTSK